MRILDGRGARKKVGWRTFNLLFSALLNYVIYFVTIPRSECGESLIFIIIRGIDFSISSY